MKKVLQFVGILFFSVLCFSGCNKSENAEKTSKKVEVQISTKPVIGFSIDTLAMERWQRDLDVFMSRIRELNADVIVQNAGNSLEEQKRQLNYLCEKNVDVAVVLPKSANELADSIQKLKAKGIKVISYDRLLRNCDVDLYVTINCEEVGKLMGDGMQRVTNLKNWYCILGSKDDYNMAMVLNGLYSSIRGKNINILNIFYTDGWNYDLSYSHMVKLINSGSIPQVLICGNDAVVSSILQALNEYGYDQHIPICGQDADIAACKNIINGTQDFTIYKPISQLAEKTAELAVEIARNKSNYNFSAVETKIDNGYKEVPVYWISPTLVTKDNMEEVIVNSGFHTKQEIYGRN